MRKSFAAALVVALVVAAVGWYVGLQLPRVHARQDRAWAAAGEATMSRLSLPAAFRPIDEATCRTNDYQRCFATGQGPADNVAAVRAAVAPVATGPLYVSCQRTTPVPGMAGTCVVQVPVRGSRLEVVLFAGLASARSAALRRPIYAGTRVLVHVAGRT